MSDRDSARGSSSARGSGSARGSSSARGSGSGRRRGGFGAGRGGGDRSPEFRDDPGHGRAPTGEELLPPELLDRVGDLEWVVRRVVRLLAGGLHEAPTAGRGEEFERHRPYQQGDDLRHLDWKLLARTDRLYIRRFRERSHLQSLFVLDATASMGFTGGAKVSKLRYGALLAAILGYLAREGGDRTGLLQVGGTPAGVDLPPGRSRERWHALLHALDGAEAGGSSPLAHAIEAAAGTLVPGSRLVILSDFLESDDGAQLLQTTGHLRARGDEVRAIRILSPEELGLTAGDEALYSDPEDPDRLLPAAPSRDPGYRARLDRYYDHLEAELVGQGGRWDEVNTTDPLLPFLRGWFRGERGAPNPSVRADPRRMD